MTNADYTKRNTELTRVNTGGYIAEVELLHFNRTDYPTDEFAGKEKIGQYAFVRMPDLPADHIKGELPDVDGTPVVYVGNTLNQKVAHNNAKDTGSLPKNVREKLSGSGLVLLDGVDFGWETWDGRPEWSESYVDYTGATEDN